MSTDCIPILSTTKALADFCTQAARSTFVTLDTEFIREKTYYPCLCLVQVACEQQAVIIDPLAEGIDLQPLYDLLANRSVLKVFHAARQDLEIFYHATKTIPAPLFDTQVAAMVCGYGESISYDGLVQHITGHKLDKSSRFTNWEQRPLTQKQLEYALADVVHLREIYTVLAEKLKQTGREDWIAEEMAILNDTATYDSQPEEAWERLKVRSRSPKFISILQHVATWRERTAQQTNIPRGRILKDETVGDIASAAPKTLEDLQRLRGMNKGLSKTLQQGLLEVIKQALAAPAPALPHASSALAFPSSSVPALELLRVLLKRQCDRHEVAQKLVAGRHDLESIAQGNLAKTPLSHGWRYDIFGRYASLLLEGKLALTLDTAQHSVALLERKAENPSEAP